MSEGHETYDKNWASRTLMPRNKRTRVAIGLLLGFVIIALLSWSHREEIAEDLISDRLDELGVEASYEVTSIGPRRQVIRNVRLGNEVTPNLEIEEVEITLAYGIGVPGIGALKLTKPRIAGSYDEQEGLSFGALDPIIFAESDEPAELPDFDLEIIDGQFALQTEQGKGSFRFAGMGGLGGGFEGRILGNLPPLNIANCAIGESQLEAIITVESRKPHLNGPLTIDGVSCKESASEVETATLDLKLAADRNLAGFSGAVGLNASALSQDGFKLSGADGEIELERRDGLLVAKFNLGGSKLASPQLSVATANLYGELRFEDETSRIEIRGRVGAQDARPGNAFLGSLESVRDLASDSLARPLIEKFKTALVRATPDSSFDAEIMFRQSDEANAFIVPQARWTSHSGETLLSMSQVQFALHKDGLSQVSGNFATGGVNLPKIRGRMERASNGKSGLRLRMEPYIAGKSVVAGPDLAILRTSDGGFGVTGRIVVSGEIPGGEVQRLSIPLQGGWADGGYAWLWRGCNNAPFERLEVSGLIIEEQELQFCALEQGPIVVSRRNGTNIGLSIPQQAWQGSFEGEEAQLALQSFSYSDEQGISAAQLQFVSGVGEGQTRILFDRIAGAMDESWKGEFEASELVLGPVPIDMKQANGNWSYADNVFSLGEMQFSIDDRSAERRFNTLTARDATLTLDGGTIQAEATLRNMDSDRIVSEVTLLHELSNGNGFADLAVPGISFDEELQPEQLSDLALGVIALAEGTLAGDGRIEWKDGEIISRGELRTDRFDFAAEFGPVEGVSGVVRFTDLLNLTSEPNQNIKIASINPGIEVFDGEMWFELRDWTLLNVKHGEWPFLGGTLRLRPVDLNLGTVEERRYVIEIEGADAGQFITTMELSNLAATGTFDGTLPLVFDEFGNGRIEGGLLISRSPGGNLSYIGDLIYEDLSAIGNFAFASLRSLDYNQMMVELNGPLTGEIVTSLRFDGIRQGEGASQNLVTRQIAKLPIQFYVNVRAPFYQLLTSFQSMYDPSFLRDPRDLGLLETDGTRFIRPEERESESFDEPAIQRQESEQVQ